MANFKAKPVCFPTSHVSPTRPNGQFTSVCPEIAVSIYIMREWHQHAKTHTVALSIRAPRTNISLSAGLGLSPGVLGFSSQSATAVHRCKCPPDKHFSSGCVFMKKPGFNKKPGAPGVLWPPNKHFSSGCVFTKKNRQGGFCSGLFIFGGCDVEKHLGLYKKKTVHRGFGVEHFTKPLTPCRWVVAMAERPALYSLD